MHLRLLLLLFFIAFYYKNTKAQSITDFYTLDSSIVKNKPLFIFAFCKADCVSCSIATDYILSSIKTKNEIPASNVIALVENIRQKELPFYQEKLKLLPIIPRLYFSNWLYAYACSLLNYNDNRAGGIVIVNHEQKVLFGCNIKDHTIIKQYDTLLKK